METETVKTDPNISDIDLALSRAALYRALALGFQPPTEETAARLASDEGKAVLAASACALDPDEESGLTSSAGRLTLARVKSLPYLSSSYWRLFGHTARGSVPPYETEYGSEALFQQPQELGDLLGFYHAFGLTLNAAEHERADHVSCECEFLSFLALKEAYALESRDAATVEETRKAARLFLRDHLGRFLPAFAKKLEREDRDGFYAALGELSYRLIAQECARLGVALGPANLSLRPADDERVPMACGSAGCAALTGDWQCDEEEKE